MVQEAGFTYFGRVWRRFMTDRDLDQGGMARKLQERGYGDIKQQEISRWMRVPDVPGYIPGMVADILGFSEDEEIEFQWAYTYGRVHLADEEIEDVERRAEAYKQLRRARRKRRGDGT